ncbi:sex hormone-binding globulin-like isoform X2 [Sardina pilchardus]|uniref:sex hormone-binding globulin-like isoform X2 n=1 Tax=Sardina pilchardus TaxID=27697 RepID=UPI002E15BE77
MGLTRVVLGILALVTLCDPSGRLVVDAETEKIDGGGLINLGNRERTWTPYMRLSSPLSEIQSITSYFSFRTFDPEGALFYGDTNNGEDWFVLFLRDGVPEMQIGKGDVLVSVAGGHKLNDGLWHKLELQSQGKFVVLKVNDHRELAMGLHSNEPDTQKEGFIRLALGGILVSEKKLLLPLNPLLDGCVKGGHWLNLSTPWDGTPAKTAMPCFPNIKAGSFFAGNGLAIFNTSDLLGVDPKEERIIITVNTSSTTLNGTILSLQSLQSQSTVLSVAEDTDSGMMILKVHKFDSTESTPINEKFDKDFISFDVIVKKTSVAFETKHVSSESHLGLTVEGDYSSILAEWNEGMLLAFGGVPDGADSGSDYLEGCLDSIFVQGQKIDLDQAFFKDASVSSHSCPV